MHVHPFSSEYVTLNIPSDMTVDCLVYLDCLIVLLRLRLLIFLLLLLCLTSFAFVVQVVQIKRGNDVLLHERIRLLAENRLIAKTYVCERERH